MELYMQFVNAFWVGGLICALVQMLMERTKIMPGRIMVLLVVTGTLISFFGYFDALIDYAGGGVTVPLIGYGNMLMSGVKDAVDESGFIGLFRGGFTSGSVGLAAALIFGYIASIVFEPKMKK